MVSKTKAVVAGAPVAVQAESEVEKGLRLARELREWKAQNPEAAEAAKVVEKSQRVSESCHVTGVSVERVTEGEHKGGIITLFEVLTPAHLVGKLKPSKDGRPYLFRDIGEKIVEYEFEGVKYVSQFSQFFGVKASK